METNNNGKEAIVQYLADPKSWIGFSNKIVETHNTGKEVILVQ